jgi:hypothetical protein
MDIGVVSDVIIVFGIVTIWFIVGALTLLYEVTQFENELRLFESLFILVLWPIFWFLRTMVKFQNSRR